MADKADVMNFRAILGGGGRPNIEGRVFVDAALELSGASHPRILLVPTPKAQRSTHESAVAAFRATYGQRASRIEELHSYGTTPIRTEALEMLAAADMVWIFGGDTKRLVDLMVSLKLVDEFVGAFTDAAGTKVVGGISAGAICWFELAQSDTDSYNLANPADPWDYQTIPGFGLIDGVGGAHFNRFHPQTGYPRSMNFRKIVAGMPEGTLALTVTNQAAWRMFRGSVSVLDSESTGQGFKIVRRASAPDGLDVTSFSTGSGEFSLAELLAT